MQGMKDYYRDESKQSCSGVGSVVKRGGTVNSTCKHQHANRGNNDHLENDNNDDDDSQSCNVSKNTLEEKIEWLEKSLFNFQKFESPRLVKNYKNESLAEEVLYHYVPPTFKFPKFMYDRRGDPQDHLTHYAYHMSILGALDQVKYIVFSITLKDSVQAWYLQLGRLLYEQILGE